MWVSSLVKGGVVGAGLIMAIGSQNVFVLSSALRKQHALAVAIVCILIDVVLVFSGVLGLGALIKQMPMLVNIASYLGGLFLFCYGCLAFRRALLPHRGLKATGLKNMTLMGAIGTASALSLLNPHVYLDTVVLLGSIGGQLPGQQSLWFALGASIASMLWFFTLVVGGKVLAPWFAKDSSWKKLDLVVGCTMWIIAAVLVSSANNYG